MKPLLDRLVTPWHSFGAIFAEVLVDADLGTTRMKWIDAARSQFVGGIVWGISLALQEESYVDSRNGRVVNANLADYHMPVNADIGDIDVSAIDIPDYQLDSVGARGVGEIGITGRAAAISNAIFHAMGKRVRTCRLRPAR